MPIEVGAAAPLPPGTLVDADGSPRDMRAALASGPLVLGLYKSSCEASKTIFPLLERLRQRYGPSGLTVYGVAQDSANVTRSFARRSDLTMPILIEPEGYPVSRAFDIAATPTVFLIRQDGSIAYATMGFFKPQINELADAVAAELGLEPRPLITDADADIPLFVPG